MDSNDKTIYNDEIDVLLPVYKSNKIFLKESIKSLLNQNIKVRIFCILNGMNKIENNQYINFLKEFNCHILISPNRGIAASLNYAIPYTRSNYIARQDDDDISHPDRFLIQKNYLDNHNCDVVGTNIKILDNNGNIIGKKEYPNTDLACKRQLIYKTCFCHPSTMMRREFLLKNQYPDLSSEDYALWIKALKNSIYNNLKKELYFYRRSDGQYSNQKFVTYLYFQSSINLINRISKNFGEKIINLLLLLIYFIFFVMKRRRIDFKTRLI